MTDDTSQSGVEVGDRAGTSDTQEALRRLDAALRDLIGRMEHVRARLQEKAPDTADIAELVTLLNTADARLALGLRPADPPCEEMPTQVTRRGLDDR